MINRCNVKSRWRLGAWTQSKMLQDWGIWYAHPASLGNLTGLDLFRQGAALGQGLVVWNYVTAAASINSYFYLCTP